MAFTFCAAKKPAPDRLEQIKERGTLRLANEPYFAPYEFIDPNQEGDAQYVGTDIEFAKAIADKIGVSLEIVPLDFSAVLAGIVDGKYDLAISAIAYSPTREEAMNLSDGYLFSDSTGYGFLTRAEDAEKYTSIESLKDAVVITQSGSVQEGIYNEQVKECKEFKLVANMTDGYLAVSENKADVCICSIDSASLYAEANGGLAIPDFKFVTDPKLDAVVVAMPKEGTDSLKAVVNEVIAELEPAGQFKAWQDSFREYAASLGIQ